MLMTATKSPPVAPRVQAQAVARDAEIVPGRSPAWHVLITGPDRERTAAAHLAGRRFGVYVPEIEEASIRRGAVRSSATPLFRGYVFVFVWDIDRHRDRIMACPGVSAIMRRIDGSAVVISDVMIDQIRATENSNRPLKMTIETVTKKKRWRQSIKKTKEIDVRDWDVIGVRAYSPFNRIAELDQEARNRLLMNALGLAS
jgi:transcription antitermination factor NusG